MRLGEVAAIVEHDIPVGTVLREKVGEQRLGEILVVELAAGHLLNFRARLVHDLPRERWQRVVGADHQVSLLHHGVGRVLDADPAKANHPVVAAGAR
jgi:hypothetical protein